MQQDNDPPGRLRFGVFEVDLRAGELTKRGLRVRLQEQPFQVLAMLLEKPRELVTREELCEKLWSQTVVRRGYRFLADVTPIDTAADRRPDPETGELVPPTDSHRVEIADAGMPPTRPHRTRAWTRFGFGLALVLAASLSWILYSRSHSLPKVRSLAVLPLESLSADASQDYFADGMTDALITDLSQISALRVISRTSVMTYKRVRRPLPEIAR